PHTPVPLRDLDQAVRMAISDEVTGVKQQAVAVIGIDVLLEQRERRFIVARREQRGLLGVKLIDRIGQRR
ncbi:MAG TPA: hypothetical protein VIV58_13620, partial [Kofleriaceae bacterium]